MDSPVPRDGSLPLTETAAQTLPESQIILGEAIPGEAINAPASSSLFIVLRMVLVLALAAAAIYGLVFFFKRLSRPPGQSNPYLKVLANAPLGAGSRVSVVSLGSKAWLVGASDSGGVSLISEIEDQELVDAMLLDESRNGSRGGGGKLLNFSALLRRLGGAAAPDHRPTPESLRKRRERLKDL
ncbi:flagellar biosynthetic protein FliO [Treponema primitia]|uniref:flagellar biosynthetic protein FliO n=1 Tax=Treponema primitia TaxID=88058 RepID=UPI001FE1215A|nr:flagellar biosynthetic protein FliO [Treponema primitia]